MHELADRLAGVVDVDSELEREFEARLVESSTLAVRIAFSVLRHREDAEDVAQEAFAKAYRSFRQLRDRERFRAWLARMTWRLAIDRFRARKRSTEVEAIHGDTVAGRMPTTGEVVAFRERSTRLWNAIDELPEKLRVVIVLASIEGHDLKEVGLLLGLPEGTVKSRLFLARQRLRERLQWTISDQTP